MHIDILTLFPEMFDSPFSTSILKRAIDRELVSIGLHNIRDHTHDRHHIVDDSTYGGGSGMILKPEPIFEAVESIKAGFDRQAPGYLPVVLLAAMVVVDAVARLLPGVLGSEVSAADDSYATGLLEYPQYTRPEVYRGWSVPQILLSGNHARIARWRREQAIQRTMKRRPELLDKANLCLEERKLVNKLNKS
jgi:tRNA (guanine37-N1)-methyltransferase